MANLNINGRTADPNSIRQIPVPDGQKPADYLKANESLIRKNFRDELYFEQDNALYVTEDKFVIQNLGLRNLSDTKIQMNAIPAVPLFLDNEPESHKATEVKIEGAGKQQAWLDKELKIKPGGRVNLHDLQREADRLFDSQRFLAVDFVPSASEKGVAITLKVQPVPEQIQWQGQGVSAQAVEAMFPRPLTRENINTGIEKLQAHFRQNDQFLLQDIQVDVQGEQLLVGASQAEIPQQLQINGGDQHAALFPKPYTQANIEKGTLALRQALQAQGQIIPSLEVTVNGKSLSIDYKSTETPQALIVSGSSVFTDQALRDLVPRPLTMENIEKGLQAIKSHYQEAGYVLLEPDGVSADLSNGELNVIVREARLSAVAFTGNDKTQTEVLRREIRTQPGEAINLHHLQKDLERIGGSSTLGNLQHRIESDGQTDNGVNLKVHVSEDKASSLNVGAGYSLSNGPFGTASMNIGNLQGKNRKVSADVSLGTKVIGGGVSYYDPWAFKDRTSLGASVYHRHWQGPFSDEDRTGAKVTVGKPLGDIYESPWRVDMTASAERIGIDKPFSMDGDGVDFRASVRPTLTYNTLDDPVLPHTGKQWQLSMEPISIDGKLLGKVDSKYEQHFGLNERMTLSAGIQGGSVFGDAPLYEKYNNAANGRALMGWESDGSLVGSNYALGSVALRTEIWGPVSATAKVTAGDYFEGFDMQPKVGAGVGVNVKLGKFGVLHAGYGMKLLGKESGDKGGAFHIGFGIPF